jgi:hypothetical protein
MPSVQATLVKFMKRYLLLVLLLTTSFLVYSQDVIVTTEGKDIKCKVLEIDSSRVYMIQEGRSLKTFISRDRVQQIHYSAMESLAEEEIAPGNKIMYGTSENRNLGNSLTIGVLEGGGSLVGFDYETLLTKNFGLQLGMGLVGFGAGLNHHFRPGIRTSFMSLQYWHQGFGETYTQSLLGPSYVFRAKKFFTCQIGFGFALEKGPAWPETTVQPPVMLTYAVGGYFPF